MITSFLKVSSNNLTSYILVGLSFLINPFITVILIGLYIVTGANNKRELLGLWIILISAWISLVNLTKIPAGDQPLYQEWYCGVNYIPSITTIFKYAGPHTFKEPVYGIIQYFAHLIFWGNVKPFWFLISFLGYVYILQSVKIILLKSGQGWQAVIFGVICCVFFNQYFYTTLHLIRQVLAFSLVLYSLALRIEDGRIHWIPLVCGPLIHTTAALFSILILIPFIYHRMKLRQLLIFSIPLLIVTVGSVAFGSFMVSLLGADSGAGYAFEKLSTAVSDGLDSNPMVVAIMLIPLSFIALLNLVRLYRGGYMTYNSPLYPVLYLFIFLSIFILSMSARPVIQYRFVFVTYQMMPLIVPLLFRPKNPYRIVYFLVAGLFFFIRFFQTLPYSKFHYIVTAPEILIWPTPSYFCAI